MSDKRPWGGRFIDKTDQKVAQFTSSIDFDSRLYRYDIKGSIAHCRMLAKQSIISDDEAAQIIEGLQEIEKEIESGEFEFDRDLEDIHMNIESRLIERIGNVAQKLHTARSRNDQVALDIRMYLRDEISNILNSLHNLKKVLVRLARQNIDVILPGYTHFQHAQVILLAHYFMAYYEMLKRDSARLEDGLKRINASPLGSAALAGTTYPIDMEYTARLLDFPAVIGNSLDGVSDRDFIIEFLASASICMVHLSRLSEEMICWSSQEFGFIEIPDAFATGSSIMPQKKNPDVFELIRGKTGRVFGNLIALLTVMKSLPLAYNRDMQEDKEPLFDTVDTLRNCLDVLNILLPRLKVKREVMDRAARSGYMNATDMADYLVRKGMTFRDAHRCVGKAVSYAIEQGRELHELSLEELNGFSELFTEDVFEYLTPEQMVNRRLSKGGTARTNVIRAIEAAENDLGIEEL
nr:argininosuccinate lyase [Desulfobacterales bacterium]